MGRAARELDALLVHNSPMSDVQSSAGLNCKLQTDGRYQDKDLCLGNSGSVVYLELKPKTCKTAKGPSFYLLSLRLQIAQCRYYL